MTGGLVTESSPLVAISSAGEAATVYVHPAVRARAPIQRMAHDPPPRPDPGKSSTAGHPPASFSDRLSPSLRSTHRVQSLPSHVCREEPG